MSQPKPEYPPNGGALAWGLSALFIGSTSVILFPLTMLCAGIAAFYLEYLRVWDKNGLELADRVWRVLAALYILSNVFALGSALTGILKGIGRKESIGAAVGGFVMGVGGLICGIMYAVVFSAISDQIWKEYPQRTGQPPLMKSIQRSGG